MTTIHANPAQLYFVPELLESAKKPEMHAIVRVAIVLMQIVSVATVLVIHF